MTETLKRTALYDAHASLNARLVPFAGWEMPVQYTSILEEARAVRSKGGIFDVSHMGRIHVSGSQATDLMDWIETGNIGTLREHRARYSLVCNQEGGTLDDTVTYRLAPDRYLLICNASNRDTIVAWLERWRDERYPQTTLEDVTLETIMIAIQGPEAANLMDNLCPQQPSALRFFTSTDATVDGNKAFIGRTGYTGEDGFEVVMDAAHGPALWQAFLDRGMAPSGLGARDVLRLEAGLALHGNDIDPTTTPLEAGLDRFVKLDKEFVGVQVLRRQRDEGVKTKLVGLLVEGRSLPRHDYPIISQGKQVGRVTSGGYSPTLDRNIAMGYLPPEFASPDQRLQVDIRGRLSNATVTTLPFYTRKRN